MNAKWVTASAAAALLASVGFVNTANAAPKALTGIDANGNTIDSGWTWDTSAALAPLVNLVFIRAEGNNFFFEKDAEIQRISDPIVITFNRVGNNASTLVINDEAVVNNSGEDWTNFRMELSSGSSAGGTPNFAFTTSDGAPGIGDFRIDPFTSFTFSNQNSTLELSGGTVKAGSTWFPGSQSNTGLAIVASANDTTFTLKEIPSGGGFVIPLPAAAWTGLSGLLGLGLIGVAKRVRRIA
jgi:hypothetical protein